MRVLLALMIVLMVNVAGSAQTDPPTTQPSAAALSPKETLLYWSDHITSMSVDDVLKTYAFSGDNQKALAQVTAEMDVAVAKLRKSVDAKWGKDSEAVVMHAVGSDTRKDDEQAEEAVIGDHATVKFKLDGLSPVPLVRVDGQWKVDIAAMVPPPVDHLNTLNDVENIVHHLTAIVGSETAAIADGKYSDAGHLVEDFQSQVAKMQ